MSIYPRRPGFKRVAYISREDQDENRTTRAADNLPIGFLEETITLASEDEIAIANINMKKLADIEQRKARKNLDDVSNVVDAVATKKRVRAKAPSKGELASK